MFEPLRNELQGAAAILKAISVARLKPRKEGLPRRKARPLHLAEEIGGRLRMAQAI
jgi:hypothetical protein